MTAAAAAAAAAAVTDATVTSRRRYDISSRARSAETGVNIPLGREQTDYHRTVNIR